MHFSRRHILRLLGGATLSGVSQIFAPKSLHAAESCNPIYFLSTNVIRENNYRIASLSSSGSINFELSLPGRGHGITIRPGQKEAVVFARRPGNFAMAIDLAAGIFQTKLKLPNDSHFYGHGIFSPDGARLFTTENDFEKGEGIIGVWDITNNYRRINEFKSYGIGPHELIMLDNGRTLAVANGGVRTHPDTGRRKLNIMTMNPSLVYLESKNGRILEQYAFEQRRHQKLSIRHLSANHIGTICIALQDQGPWRDQMPLVAFHRPGSGKLELAEAPAKTTRQLRGYMGSSTIDRSGKIAAVSAPRGGVITFWDMDTYSFLTEIHLQDACGVAATAKNGEFFITSGSGKIIFFDVVSKQKNEISPRLFAPRRWDNHAISTSS